MKTLTEKIGTLTSILIRKLHSLINWQISGKNLLKVNLIRFERIKGLTNFNEFFAVSFEYSYREQDDTEKLYKKQPVMATIHERIRNKPESVFPSTKSVTRE